MNHNNINANKVEYMDDMNDISKWITGKTEKREEGRIDRRKTDISQKRRILTHRNTKEKIVRKANKRCKSLQVRLYNTIFGLQISLKIEKQSIAALNRCFLKTHKYCCLLNKHSENILRYGLLHTWIQQSEIINTDNVCWERTDKSKLHRI